MSDSHPAIRVLGSIVSVVIVGFLWLLASVPIVTIVSATAALFSVTGRPVSRPASAWSTFWAGFTQHIRQATALGGLLAIAIAILTINVTIALQHGGVLATAVIVIATLTALIVGGTLVFLFPLMAAHPSPLKRTLRNAALLAGGYPLVTITGLTVLGIGAALIALTPPLLPIVAGVAALSISKLVERVFDRVIERQSAD